MNENKKALKELEDFYESLPAPFFLTEDLNFKYFKKYLKVFNKIEKEIKKRKEAINNPTVFKSKPISDRIPVRLKTAQAYPAHYYDEDGAQGEINPDLWYYTFISLDRKHKGTFTTSKNNYRLSQRFIVIKEEAGDNQYYTLIKEYDNHTSMLMGERALNKKEKEFFDILNSLK